MASHPLIDHQLAELGRRLPTDTVDELADGLAQTYQQHLATGLQPAAAAAAAIAEFGDADQLTTAFTRAAPGRRAALTLLATGPVFAVCWAPSLLIGHAWTWPIPVAAALAFGVALLTVVATLLVAATSQHNYQRTRLTGAAAIGLIGLDIAMVATVLLAAPTLVWPMTVAIPASLVRIWLTISALPPLVAA